MKFAALFLLLLPLLLCGCESINKEDRDFYYGGWLHPDAAAEKRMYGDAPKMPD